MSLRQLKFKPKLQLNSSLKNKIDENSSSPSSKEVCNRSSTGTIQNNSSSNSVVEALMVEADIVKKSSPIKIDECKDTSPHKVASLKNPDYYNLSGKAAPAVNINISKIQNGPASIIPVVDLSEPVIAEIAKCNTNEKISNSNDGSLDKIEVHSNSGSKSNEGFDLLLSSNVSESDDSDDEKNVQFPGSVKKNQNHLINYDVLEKISSKDNQQSDLLCSDALKKIDKVSILKDSDTNENLTTSSDLPHKLSQDEKTELPLKNVHASVKFIDHSSIKVPRFLHKPNLGLSKNSNTITTVSENTAAESNCEGKNAKIKKNENKCNISSKKVGTHQRTNFKPNLTTLGKIRRPEKFTMSSYSKMESIAKEQFIKKFGKEQEPDTSRLTMMDLIFYNPSSNPMSQSFDEKNLKNSNNTTVTKKEQEKNIDISPSTEKKTEEELKNGDDAIPVPQLTISADGKVIVSQESLVIKPSQNLMNCNFETVIDGEFRKKKPIKNPNRCGWSHLDTIKFYKALNSLGCDFETMQTLFPGRSRRNLKSKFKKEEKLHGSLINKVVSHHSEFDLTNVVRELEIDSVYQSTIKDYGRGLSENGKRPGRKKSLSSVVAGKSSEKDDEEDSDDDFIDDDEFPRRKRKADPVVISKISNVLGLNDTNDLTISEIKNKLSKSDVNDVTNMREVVPSKRKRRKSKENVESDNDMESDRKNLVTKKITESEGSKHPNLHKKNRNLRKNKKPHSECLPNKNIIIRLEDLIDFNEGVDNEAQTNSKTEIINENHIVINTNIEFEHVKYTRYISYNSSNLENPIEINETVAHVD